MRIRKRCRLGPVSATLVTDDADVFEYLGQFYAFAGPVRSEDWVIQAVLGAPAPGMSVNEWGVGYRVSADGRRMELRCEHAKNLAISTRKVLREVLVDHCESQGYVMLHASAVADENRVIVVVGDKGSGKTTLALKAALAHGMRYLSNDHLILFPSPPEQGYSGDLVLTSLPTPIPVKIGTYLDLQQQLPAPWDTEGIDVGRYANAPRESLYGSPVRVLYTFPQLGQDSPAEVRLRARDDGPPVLVVLAEYTGGPVESLLVEDPVGALLPHVRTDWMFDRALNQRFMPRSERQAEQYERDARRLVAQLGERATVIRWRHHGDPAELLDMTTVGR